MKTLIVHCGILILTLLNVQEEATCQAFYPAYGGMPNCDDGDDDLGLILTALLFAKQRGNKLGYTGPCENSTGKRKTIPVPYPIPFPTNNAIIYRSKSSDESNDDSSSEECSCQGSEKEADFHASSEKNNESSRNTTIKYVPMLASESIEIEGDK